MFLGKEIFYNLIFSNEKELMSEKLSVYGLDIHLLIWRHFKCWFNFVEVSDFCKHTYIVSCD